LVDIFKIVECKLFLLNVVGVHDNQKFLSAGKSIENKCQGKILGFYNKKLLVSIKDGLMSKAKLDQITSPYILEEVSEIKVRDSGSMSCIVHIAEGHHESDINNIIVGLSKDTVVITNLHDTLSVKIIFTNQREKNKFFDRVKSLDLIHLIECYQQFSLHNYYAIASMMGNAIDGYDKDDNAFVYGEGVIITVIDSGADPYNCCLSDQDNPVTYIKINKRNYKEEAVNIQQSKHRRILAYAAFDYKPSSQKSSDFTDEYNGHGSHTSCSSIYGSTIPNTCGGHSKNIYQSKAKLLLIDSSATEEAGSSIYIPNSFYWVMEFSKLAGSSILSCSWGSPVNNYTYTAYEIDKFIINNPEYSVVIAAGNSGPAMSSISTPGTSKNGLTIGASSNSYESYKAYEKQLYTSLNITIDEIEHANDILNSDCVPDFSSRGPTSDGRIKPDVIAPGSFILSAASNGENTTYHNRSILMRGTSMATPLVSNMLSFITHTLKKRNGIEQPSNALKKAIIIGLSQSIQGHGQRLVDINGKKKIASSTNTIPPESYGFGHVNLKKFIQDDFGFIEGSLTSYSAPYTLCLTSNIFPEIFSITLVYDDPPAYPTSSSYLVNDLNIRAVAFKGNYTFISGLNGNTDNMTEVFDNKNNVEKINIRAKDATTVRIQVSANGVIYNLDANPNQKFAIVWDKKIQISECPFICSDADLDYTCHVGDKAGSILCNSENESWIGYKYDACTLNVIKKDMTRFYTHEESISTQEKEIIDKYKEEQDIILSEINVILLYFIINLILIIFYIISTSEERLNYEMQ
jgi:hypothetical protein